MHKFNKKNPLVEVVKTPQKQAKVTRERKNVFIIGDSMIEGLAERDISKDHNVKVRPQPGCTTEDIEDHINPDAIIIHSGTNDATNDKSNKPNKKI